MGEPANIKIGPLKADEVKEADRIFRLAFGTFLGLPDPQDFMQRVRLLADLPVAERPKVRLIDTKGAWFKAEVDRMRRAKGADFSACDVQIPAEVH